MQQVATELTALPLWEHSAINTACHLRTLCALSNVSCSTWERRCCPPHWELDTDQTRQVCGGNVESGNLHPKWTRPARTNPWQQVLLCLFTHIWHPKILPACTIWMNSCHHNYIWSICMYNMLICADVNCKPLPARIWNDLSHLVKYWTVVVWELLV